MVLGLTLAAGAALQAVAAERATGGPRMLLPDEPSLGLSPLSAGRSLVVVRDLNAVGLTILPVEQTARQALRSTHRACLTEQGRVGGEGRTDARAHDPAIVVHCLGRSTQPARVTA